MDPETREEVQKFKDLLLREADKILSSLSMGHDEWVVAHEFITLWSKLL